MENLSILKALIFPVKNICRFDSTIATAVKELGVTISKQPTCSFLAQQIRFLCTSPKARRYSVDMIISRFSFYHRNRACYLELQKVLVLPSIRVLRDISSNLSVGANFLHDVVRIFIMISDHL